MNDDAMAVPARGPRLKQEQDSFYLVYVDAWVIGVFR